MLNNLSDGAPHRTWALLGARPGDNDQVIALAEALGSPYTVKLLEYNRLHALGPRLLGSSIRSLRRASRDAVLEAPPDLTISTGHRSVPVVRALRRRSCRTRSIHVGFPRVSPGAFDLVITTPQYPVADHPNVLRIPYALTRVGTKRPDRDELGSLKTLPSPRRLLVVGGPTLFWELDEQRLHQTLFAMLEEARAQGGSVLVTTSPRTPASVTNDLASIVNSSGVESLLAVPGRGPSYQSLLCAADSIRVTADSVSMVSDAIWTGKPLALVPIAMSFSGRIAFALNDWLRPKSPAYPQDLRFFWETLQSIGITDHPAIARSRTKDVLEAVAARARGILRSA